MPGCSVLSCKDQRKVSGRRASEDVDLMRVISLRLLDISKSAQIFFFLSFYFLTLFFLFSLPHLIQWRLLCAAVVAEARQQTRVTP